MILYLIAEATGHRVSEIRQWPAAEVWGWVGFFKGRAAREKKAMEDAKSKRGR